MKKKKEKIYRELEYFTTLLEKSEDEPTRQKLVAKIETLKALLLEAGESLEATELSPEKTQSSVPLMPAGPDQPAWTLQTALQARQRLMWFEHHQPGSPWITKLQSQLAQARLELPDYPAYEAEQLRGLARDGRPLNQLPLKPAPHVLYVAPDLARARALDQAGYQAVWLEDPAALAAFTGSDIVFTSPELHHLAVGEPGHFVLVYADCWAQGQLDVAGAVPAMTHLLSLAETQDLIPIQTAARGRQAQALYKAYGDGDTARYQGLARKLGAA